VTSLWLLSLLLIGWLNARRAAMAKRKAAGKTTPQKTVAEADGVRAGKRGRTTSPDPAAEEETAGAGPATAAADEQDSGPTMEGAEVVPQE
jgi:hypothetical protein